MRKRDRIVAYVVERAKEPSTWRGLALIAAAAGIPASPEAVTAVTQIGLGLAGVIGAALPDRVR